MACTPSANVPDDVLDSQRMAEILEDFHLLEFKIQQLNLPIDSQVQVYAHFEAKLLQKHMTDSLTYQKSLEFYSDHPDLMFTIYETVVDSLTLREKTRKIE